MKFIKWKADSLNNNMLNRKAIFNKFCSEVDRLSDKSYEVRSYTAEDGSTKSFRIER